MPTTARDAENEVGSRPQVLKFKARGEKGDTWSGEAFQGRAGGERGADVRRGSGSSRLRVCGCGAETPGDTDGVHRRQWRNVRGVLR